MPRYTLQGRGEPLVSLPSCLFSDEEGRRFASYLRTDIVQGLLRTSIVVIPCVVPPRPSMVLRLDPGGKIVTRDRALVLPELATFLENEVLSTMVKAI